MPETLDERAEERASGAPGSRGGEPHYQPQLDGIRGLAILAVLISHAAAVIHAFPETDLAHKIGAAMMPGWGGVDLFFALSGFLITGILIRGKGRPHYFSSFYARRVLRIFPIYYLFLIVSLLACTQIPALRSQVQFSDAHLPATALQRFSFFLYLQNLPVFWPYLAFGMNGLWGAYWSLAVEEQFYLLWPTLVRFLKLTMLYWLCIAAVLAGPLIRNWVSHYTGDTLGLLQFPITRLDGLFAGAALALYRQLRGKPLPLLWAGIWFALGTAILLYIAHFHGLELILPGFYINRFGVSGFALVAVGLIAATQHRVPPLNRFLVMRPLLFLGKVSYGIYVYHLGVYFTFRRLKPYLVPALSPGLTVLYDCLYYLAAMLLVMLLAQLSFTYVERPILALKRYFPSAAGTR